ncbi:hypothetical protein TNIN_439061 [Trichonephila inaurata madagascariensis]|uniref:Uncharacterized protein n=1 Tax=Trichonephila inaurata madagascariensis TaxID=2747483 RepID=A0A8X6YMS8_9ARAC|nr:hypothetical protein TNIN_439061 [Trichonephila inaurata madagascariensis]
MRLERRADLARELKKLIDDYEGTNAPKLCKKLKVPLKELLKRLEKSNDPTQQETIAMISNTLGANNDYFSWQFFVGLHNFITN